MAIDYTNYLKAIKSGDAQTVHNAAQNLMTTKTPTANRVESFDVGSYFDGGNTSTGTSGNTGTYSTLSELLGLNNTEIDNYVNELKGMAQGDYDFAAKWLESEYKKAVGTNDPTKTAFLKQVANELERSVGRIEYDYQTGTYRTNQDKQIALDRLAEDEKVAKQDLGYEAGIAKEEQMGSLNARGLVTGPREKTVGLGSKFVSRLDEQIANKLAAIERAAGRGTTDVNINAERQLTDLTTGARRGVLDTQDTYTQNLEAQKRAKERADRQADIEGSTLKKTLAGLSGSFA